jgi:hypothetical protein
VQKLLDIYDCFISDDGKLVLCGINSNFDVLEKGEIRKIIGSEVVLHNEKYKQKLLTVVDIEIAISLINKKNIFIKVDSNLLLDIVTNGCVYKK